MTLTPIAPFFPPRTYSLKPQIPDNVEIGDIIVARYTESQWADNIFASLEDWHHAAIVSSVSPLKVIEAVGPNADKKQPEGPFEVEFEKSIAFGLAKENLIRLKWLKPVFPNPIREISNAKWSERKVVSEKEARQRAVDYARQQIGDDYKLSRKTLLEMWNAKTDLSADNATKWDENEWYCSLLIFKAYSRTITGMYLEVYNLRNEEGEQTLLGGVSSGFFVTPEDLVDSLRTRAYHTWIRGELQDDATSTTNA